MPNHLARYRDGVPFGSDPEYLTFMMDGSMSEPAITARSAYERSSTFFTRVLRLRGLPRSHSRSRASPGCRLRQDFSGFALRGAKQIVRAVFATVFCTTGKFLSETRSQSTSGAPEVPFSSRRRPAWRQAEPAPCLFVGGNRVPRRIKPIDSSFFRDGVSGVDSRNSFFRRANADGLVVLLVERHHGAIVLGGRLGRAHPGSACTPGQRPDSPENRPQKHTESSNSFRPPAFGLRGTGHREPPEKEPLCSLSI
jgi:hypothetical protein